jgi:hypothetical protein
LNGSNAYYTAGNFGVGTSTPGHAVEVQDTGTSRAIVGSNSTASGIGVEGLASGTDGVGIRGEATPTTGTTTGVQGTVNSVTGHGVLGISQSTSTTTTPGAGVRGEAHSTSAPGVYGFNDAYGGQGVHAESTGDYSYGLRADAQGDFGRYGVYAEAHGTATTTYGAVALSQSQAATSTNSARGIYGGAISQRARGVFGYVSGTRTTVSDDLAGVYGSCNTSNGYAVYANGNSATSGTKAFIQPHPTDASQVVQFICLEGNESGTYFRGTTRLVDGQAEIPIPEDWQAVSEADGITVQLTPIRSFARLAVMEQSRERIVVAGTEDCEFHYFVNGIRRGFVDVPTLMPNGHFKPEVAGVSHANRYPERILPLLVENGTLNADYTLNEQTAARLGWQLTDQSDIPVEERFWLTDDERRQLMAAPHGRARAAAVGGEQR